MNSEINVLLRLLNGRRFAAELTGSAASVRAFGAEVTTAGEATLGLGAATSVGRAGLFAIGAASRTASFALGALGGVALDLGFKFDATMQSNVLAFEKFTGSAALAKQELNQLFEIAAATPFTFADVTTAARRLQAFGFSAQDTVKWIKLLGDTISYTGGSAQDVLRAVKTVGEIQSLGRLQYRQVLQLTTLGIGAQGILQDRLNLTSKQWHNISHANISSATALGALQQGLFEKYGGGAEKYSKTFTGQINKVKDYTQRAAGQLVKPLFTYLQKDVFPNINKWLSGGGFKRAIPEIRKLFIGLGAVIAAPFVIGAKAGKMLWDALKPAKPFWNNVLKPFVEGIGKGVGLVVVTSFKVLVGVLKQFAGILGTVSKALGGTGDGFKVLGTIIGVFYAKKIIMLATGLSEFPGLFKLIGGAARLALIPVNLLMGGLARLPGATAIGSLGTSVGGKLATGLGAGLRMFGWAALGIYILDQLGVFKWIDKATGGPLTAPPGESTIPGGPYKAPHRKGYVPNSKDPLSPTYSPVGKTMSALDWADAQNLLRNSYTEKSMVDFKGWNLSSAQKKVLQALARKRGWSGIPGLSSGGSIMSGGWSVVGETGPELAWLPAGSHIVNDAVARASIRTPGHATTGMGGHMQAPTFNDVNVHLTAPIYIDKRQVGEAVGRYVAERQARS